MLEQVDAATAKTILEAKQFFIDQGPEFADQVLARGIISEATLIVLFWGLACLFVALKRSVRRNQTKFEALGTPEGNKEAKELAGTAFSAWILSVVFSCTSLIFVKALAVLLIAPKVYILEQVMVLCK